MIKQDALREMAKFFDNGTLKSEYQDPTYLAIYSAEILEWALREKLEPLATALLDAIIKNKVSVTTIQITLNSEKSIFELLLEYLRKDFVQKIFDSKQYDVQQLRQHLLNSKVAKWFYSDSCDLPLKTALISYLWHQLCGDTYPKPEAPSLSELQQSYQQISVPKILHFYVINQEQLQLKQKYLEYWHTFYPNYIINIWYWDRTGNWPEQVNVEIDKKNIHLKNLALESWSDIIQQILSLNQTANIKEFIPWFVLYQQGGAFVNLDLYPSHLTKLTGSPIPYGIQFSIGITSSRYIAVAKHSLIAKIIDHVIANLPKAVYSANFVIGKMLVQENFMVEKKIDALSENYPSPSSTVHPWDLFFIDEQFKTSPFEQSTQPEYQLGVALRTILRPLHEEYDKNPTPERLEIIKPRLFERVQEFIAKIDDLNLLDAITEYFQKDQYPHQLMQRRDNMDIHFKLDVTFKGKLLKMITAAKNELLLQPEVQATTSASNLNFSSAT